MKKTIFLLLALMMCLFLMSCGQGTQKKSNSTREDNQPISFDGADDLMLDVEMYDAVEYDADGKVVKTVRHIDDSSLESCIYDGNGEITLRVTEYQNDKSTVEEYFNRGNVVKIVVNVPWETRTETSDADGKKLSVVTDNTEDGFYRREDYTDGILTESYYRDAEKECTEIFDADGKLRSVVTDRTADGSYCEEYYTDGVLVKSYDRDAVREHTQTFDAGGNVVSDIIDNAEDGSHREEHYTDGVLVKSYYRDAVREQTQTFDTNGNMTAQVLDDKEQNSSSKIHWTYYEDGSVASQCVNLTDRYYTQGCYEEIHYYPGGAVSMSYKVSQYGDNKFYYDESGNPTHYEGKNNAGERVEIVYNADGSHVDRIYESGDKVRIETWGADGSLTVAYE